MRLSLSVSRNVFIDHSSYQRVGGSTEIWLVRLMEQPSAEQSVPEKGGSSSPKCSVLKSIKMLRSTVITNFLFGVLVLLIGAMPVAASSSSDATNAALIRAQTLNSQGTRQLEIGQAETALETWKQAEAAYTAAGDETGILGSQLNQVQALQTLGQYRRAKSLLEQISDQLHLLPDSLLKASSLRSLGITLFHVGDVQESHRILQSSLQISQRLKGDTSSTLLALGNVVRVRQDDPNAIAFYQQAAAVAPDNLIRLQAQLNLFSLLVENNQTPQALPLFRAISF
ncbi:tetratricopeptide repeat protein [Coleofasciculus sp. H7-2]|uniref:tetratricopeptide repeat protein n=1 Tax=Coleofasciculus sp. H7-2 TaxID=3351545 RepID=UPI00366F531E